MNLRQAALHRFNGGDDYPVFWECQPNAGVQFSLAITTTDPSPTIDWGDGTVESYTSGVAKTHTYATADGTNKYKIRIYRPELVTKIIDNESTRVRRGTLTLTQFPELVEIRIRRSSCTGNLDLGANVKLEYVYFHDNSFSGTLDLSANVELEYAHFGYNSFTSINITGCTKLVTFYALANSGLTTITGAAALGQAAGTHNIRVYSCSITAATIDAILAACVAGGRTGGYLDYKAQTGNGHLDGNRSAQGLLDIATLEGRTPAWSVVRA